MDPSDFYESKVSNWSFRDLLLKSEDLSEDTEYYLKGG